MLRRAALIARLRRAVPFAVLVALAVLPATASARVLVVGDSLEVGTGPYLRGQLRGIAALALDARVGRSSREGLRVLRAHLSSADDVVVFDLGTNDGSPAALGADLAGAAATVGDRCLVVSTLVRPRLGTALTRAVESFASAHANVEVVPWRETVAGSTGLLRRDGVHGTARGYALRAQLVAQAVQACLATGSARTPGLGAQPSLGSHTQAAPRTAPRPRKRGPSGFRVRAYRRFTPLLTSLAVGAVLGPPDELQIVTR